jgi:hypothetical protein
VPTPATRQQPEAAGSPPEQVETMRAALQSLGFAPGRWPAGKVMEEARRLRITEAAEQQSPGAPPRATPAAGSPVQSAQPAFDPAAAAGEELERMRRRARTQNELDKLTNRPPPAATPVGAPPAATPVGAPPAQPPNLAQLVAQQLGQTGGLLGRLTSSAGLGAAAAGPIGVAIAAAQLAAGKAAQQYQHAGEDVRKLGEVAQLAAGNDNLGALTRAADAGAEVLGRVPIVGQVWEQQIKAGTTSIKAFDDSVMAFVRRGKELAVFSPQLATAGARADVRKLMADMREAERLGPGLSRLSEQKSRFDTQMQDALGPLKQFWVGLQTGVLSIANDGLQNLRDGVAVLKGLPAVINSAAARLSADNKNDREAAQAALQKAVDGIRKEMVKNREAQQPADPLARFFELDQAPRLADRLMGAAFHRPAAELGDVLGKGRQNLGAMLGI